MRNKFFSLRLLVISVCCFGIIAFGFSRFGTKSQAQAALWVEADALSLAGIVGTRQIVPEAYRVFQLNPTLLTAILAAAPQEFTPQVTQSPVVLQLPMPDGSLQRFRIAQSSIMQPGLAAKYPQLKTFAGQGIDDPTATLRFDFTPRGFHGQIISAARSVYIDPYVKGNSLFYITYDRSDFVTDKALSCFFENPDNIVPRTESSAVARTADGETPERANGATLRTYRLAMAATGEYTMFHSANELAPTVPEALEGIVITMNRVNGVYERDLAVRMILIDRTDEIIYTNMATDPYSNTAGDIDINQRNIDLVIGSANYDIGHLVGTGGGGVASLRSVCVTGGAVPTSARKAMGLTGSPAPVGDPFDIDFVAHEMGHQFGGNHTFNATTGGSCAGNGNGTTAVEPGSGVTIQAYAGICGAEDVARNSIDTFHVISLDEMGAFINTGAGNTCALQTPTNNTIPTVNAGADFTIPRGTPFTLTAAGADADGDTVTYNWEDVNNGPATNAATRPLFRSYRSSLDSSRTFPSLQYILNNANQPPATYDCGRTPTATGAPRPCRTGEEMPSVDRNMRFRVTVRDNRAGAGAINDDAVTVAVAGAPFFITEPNAAETLAAGASRSVTWSVGGGSIAANVNIKLSTDGGQTFPITLAANTPNDGSETITIPSQPTEQARIKVEAADNIFFDISGADFTITAPANTAPTVALTSPTNNQTFNLGANIPLAATASDADGTIQKVEFFNGETKLGEDATAPYEFTVSNAAAGSYVFTARATDDDGATTTSAPVNAIVNNAITLAIANLNLGGGTAATVVAGGCARQVGTVTLNAPAPAGGATVTLANFNQQAQVPASVVVPEGATSRTFIYSTTAVAQSVSGRVNANLNGTQVGRTLTVRPIGLRSMGLSSSVVTGGGTVEGTVRLECAAAPGDITVTLRSSNSAAQVPASITIPQGQTAGTFTVTTSPQTKRRTVAISASASGTLRQVGLQINP